MAVLVLALPASASAFLGLGETAEFSAPTEPTAPFTLDEGPDGNVWYTNEGSTKIGKVTPAGVVTEYSPGLSSAAYGIAAGPDGNVWFTEPGAKKVGYIKPSEPTTSLTEFSVTNMPAASFITAGPDGNLWLSLATSGIARVTPAGVVTEFAVAQGSVCSITAGPDGNVWFTTCTGTRGVGKITPSGTITHYPVTGSISIQSTSIALGADGRLWVATSKSTTERIAAVTTAGVVTSYTTPTAVYTSFTSGADGNVWARNAVSVNERQRVTIKATETLGGTYKLTFKGQETSALNFNASAAEVETALVALPAIGSAANVDVVTGFSSENLVEQNVDFIGKLGRNDTELMSCTSALTGVSPSCTVETVTTGSPVKLVRITPTGTVTEFPLKSSAVFSTASAKANSLAEGPDSSLWYASSGAAEVPKSIGKFGLGIEKPELTVVKEGTGSGTVVSSPTGIECGGKCSASFTKDSKVTLTASPSAGSLFVSWKGCEKGGVNGRQCTVTMDVAKTVYAKFVTAYDVEVTRKGSGLGKVSSSPGGVLCLSNCSSTTAAFKEGTAVTLNAAPSKNFTFTGWSGDCSGTGPCVLGTLSADKEVEAEFTEVAKHLLTVTKSGGGQGTAKSNLAGINCGATCSEMASAYYQGQVVELTATPGKGSAFGGWSGGGCSGTGTCTVTMSEAKSVTAEFK